MTSSSTRFVPTDEFYERPPSSASRIAAIAARQPRVDANGKIVESRAETGTVDVTGTVGKSLSMASALIEAARAVGADPARLVDSEKFMVSLGPISPNDSAGLQGAVLDALAQNPSLAVAPVTPGMLPNRAQGASGSGGAVPSHPKSTLERIHEQAAKAANQPLPPGSTVV
jgi:hypothetical protein